MLSGGDRLGTFCLPIVTLELLRNGVPYLLAGEFFFLLELRLNSAHAKLFGMFAANLVLVAKI